MLRVMPAVPSTAQWGAGCKGLLVGGRIKPGGALGPPQLLAMSLRVRVPPPFQSLLRQTQLRSLSKSDTKLHELYRVKARDDSEWLSSGRGEASGPWQVPAGPAPPR
uniref:Uncharacterized protein n=1 Tax=Bubo bubo TaxID=30461 RepID=A0A8C0FR81_BUBBB